MFIVSVYFSKTIDVFHIVQQKLIVVILVILHLPDVEVQDEVKASVVLLELIWQTPTF